MCCIVNVVNNEFSTGIYSLVGQGVGGGGRCVGSGGVKIGSLTLKGANLVKMALHCNKLHPTSILFGVGCGVGWWWW